jgi:ABC-type glutathione transport system ATPase component
MATLRDNSRRFVSAIALAMLVGASSLAPAQAGERREHILLGQQFPHAVSAAQAQGTSAAPMQNPRLIILDEPVSATSSGGNVRFFNRQKGFGFIQPDAGGRDPF